MAKAKTLANVWVSPIVWTIHYVIGDGLRVFEAIVTGPKTAKAALRELERKKGKTSDARVYRGQLPTVAFHKWS